MTQDAPLLISAKNIPSGTQLTVRGEIVVRDSAPNMRRRAAAPGHHQQPLARPGGRHLHGQLRAPRTDRRPAMGRAARRKNSPTSAPGQPQRVKEGRRRARRLTRWRLDRRKDGAHGFSYPLASLGVAAAWR